MASITAGSVLSLGWASGCSVLYDLSTKQCSVDADCAALGGSFESLACVDNLCQAPPVTGCQSNAQCMDEQGQGFDPWACVESETAEGSLRRERNCVPLRSTECPTVLPQGADGELWRENLRTENPLILGGTGLIGGSTLLDQRTRNYDLALTELTYQNQGLPGGRQVVMVACGSIFDEEGEFEREMEHLTNELKVPGIVSALLADDLQRAFNDYGKDAQTFFMSALESDATVAALPDDGLIWHIGPGVDVMARAYAPLLKRTLTYLGMESATNVKVATVVTADERFLSNMVPTIERTPDQYGVSFNGKTVAVNRNELNYTTISVASGSMSSVSAQIDEILTFLPNVIISAADRQFVLRIMPAIESQWPEGGPPKPFYLLSPYNYNDPALQNLMQSNSALSSRIAGVNGAAAADTNVYDAYVGRYQTAYPENRNELGYENFYDAAYYTLYAAAGAGQSLVNGQNLKSGMNRLLSGAGPYNVGPEQMPTAMATLAGSGSATIQLNGTLGPPDWNTADGTRKSYGSVWCVDAGRNFRADVLRYVPNDVEPTQAQLTGTFPCIPDF